MRKIVKLKSWTSSFKDVKARHILQSSKKKQFPEIMTLRPEKSQNTIVFGFRLSPLKNDVSDVEVLKGNTKQDYYKAIGEQSIVTFLVRDLKIFFIWKSMFECIDISMKLIPHI